MTKQLSPTTRKAIKTKLTLGLSAFRRSKPIPASDWADEHGYIVPTRKGAYTGPLKGLLTQYQRDMLDIFALHGTRNATVRKASRLGISVVAEHYVAFAIVERLRNVIVYATTKDAVSETEKEQFGPLIKYCKPWRAAMLGDPDKQGRHNSVSTKLFRGASLFLRPLRTKSGGRRLSGDIVLFDEYESMAAEVDGEGNVSEVGDSRIRSSAFPQKFIISSPGTVGSCKISQALEDADKVLRWYIPAPCCGQSIHLKWGGADADFGIKFSRTEQGKCDQVWYQCQNCKDTFNYQQMLASVDDGRWQTDDGDAYFCRELRDWRDAKDVAIERIKHPGFDQDSLVSKTYHWRDDVDLFLRAQKANKRGDRNTFKTWVQTVRGQPYEDTPDKVGKAATFLARAEQYNSQVPRQVRALFAGGDMQANRCEVTIYGIGLDDEWWAIEHVIVPGRIDTAAARRQLGAILQTVFETEDGRLLNLTAAALDSGYMPTDVHSFCREMGIAWCFPVHGTQTLHPRKPIATPPKKPVAKYGTFYTEVGGDDAVDRIYRRLSLQKPKDWVPGLPLPGYIHYPIGRGFDEGFFKQLVEVEVLTTTYDRRGNAVQTYRKISEGLANEALDCAKYALAAYQICVILYGLSINTYEQHQATEAEQTSGAAELGAAMRKRLESTA